MKKAWKRLARWIEGSITALGLLLLIVSFTPLVRWWASAYAGPLVQPQGEVLIVLAAAGDDSGGISYSSYWRARAAAEAWRTGHFQRVILCGAGAGMMQFLIAEGVPPAAILDDWQSKSTRGNALAAAQLLSTLPGRKVLLTSDFHMLRALAVFRKLHIDVAPLPAPDVLETTEAWSGRFAGFLTMTVETAKIVDYKLHGWV